MFRITPLTLWQAAASGMTGGEIAEELQTMDRAGFTDAMKSHVIEVVSRYGQLVLEKDGEHLRLSAEDWKTMQKICALARVAAFFEKRLDASSVSVRREYHGELKRELIRAGYPVIDRTGWRNGNPLPLRLNPDRVTLRDYQAEAVREFCRADGEAGGVIVLPCGTGKTVTAIGVLAELKCEALILTGSVTSVRQWKAELMDKTNAREDWIGEYAAGSKQVRPITIATYQTLTTRDGKGAKRNLGLLHRRDWGIIIYDEVHLLPAPVFRLTAEVQTSRRLGLTATLVREDGREEDVFSLIGPKRYDLSWRSLETKGYVARVRCVEVEVPFPAKDKSRYMAAEKRCRHRIAAENPLKLEAAAHLVRRHAGGKILVIGQYLDQLGQLADRLSAPIITGRTPQGRRDELFYAFRDGPLDVLVVSKVANFAVDLPEASVAIQVSGGFGSRQEEAQRVGRILRPKRDGREAWFYTLVTEDSCEKEFARKRRRFLVGQGYAYREERYETDRLSDEENQAEARFPSPGADRPAPAADAGSA